MLSSGLTLRAIKAAALANLDRLYGGLALPTRQLCAAIDPQRLLKVTGFAFGIAKVAQSGAPLSNGSREYRLNGACQLLVFSQRHITSSPRWSNAGHE